MITDQKTWDEYTKNNQYPYGGCCVKIAGRVMEILDEDPSDFDTHEIICKAEEDVGEDGITGFMAGAIASMVSQCHSRGEEFRAKWNKDHGVEESEAKEGTVNPAVITITDENNSR